MLKSIIEVLSEYVFGFFLKWMKLKRHNKLISSLKDEIAIYKSLEKLLKDTNASRIMFFYFHNGGGCIIPGKPKFLSLIEETCKDDISCIDKEKAQKILVDRSYLNYVINMLYSEEFISFKETKDLENGRLKDIFELEEIENSMVAYIASNEDYIWYLSLNFKEEGIITTKFRNSLRECRDTIANILEKYFTINHRC